MMESTEPAKVKRTKILIVDDEKNVLAALSQRLRRKRRVWATRFALGAYEALGELENEPCDIIVSDMRMPGMDGVQLLEQVRDRYPDTLRIMLSGNIEDGLSLRAASVAHQFLSKPCDPMLLEHTINSMAESREQVRDGALRRLLGGLDVLPTTPGMRAELDEVLAQPGASASEIAEVVGRDSAISGKLLQLCNSGYFALSRRVISVAEAVSYLGVETIRSLTLLLDTIGRFESRTELGNFDFHEYQRHLLATAFVAKGIHGSDEAFTAGVMHDVGKLVLALGVGSPATDWPPVSLKQSRREELVAYGVTHCDVGSYLLSLWGLPDDLIVATRHHHRPSLVTLEIDLVGAVHIAEVLVGSAEPDPAFFEAIGGEERLREWGELGKSALQSASALAR